MDMWVVRVERESKEREKKSGDGVIVGVRLSRNVQHLKRLRAGAAGDLS